MPCVIDDCEIPLFLRDKLYADFRSDADGAFALVDQSLARISNPHQGRSESPKFHTDWSIDWSNEKNEKHIRLSFVDHAADWPYVIWSQCTIALDEENGQKFSDAIRRKEHDAFMLTILEKIAAGFDKKPLTEKIDSNFEKYVAWEERLDDGSTFFVFYSFRRMGVDTGMDTLVYLDNNIRMALNQMRDVNYRAEVRKS
jgi:hypothetical protein